MDSSKKVAVEPAAFCMTGFNIDELVSPKFLAELRKEYPTAVVAAMTVAFTDSPETILVAHQREERRFVPLKVEVHGLQPAQSAKGVEIIKRSIGQ